MSRFQKQLESINHLRFDKLPFLSAFNFHYLSFKLSIMNNIFYQLSLILLLGLASVQSSCTLDDDKNDCDEQQLTFELNGESWSGAAFDHSIFFGEDPQTNVEALRCDIRATNISGDQIILTINNPNAINDHCLELGQYTPVGSLLNPNDNVFFFTYIGLGSGSSFSAIDGTLDIAICIAGDTREIMGNFSFNDSSGNFEGTEGLFKVCVQ